MARLDDQASAYPPYNIEVLGEDAYRITMAVAGFSLEDLDIVVENGRLSVSGHAQGEDEPKEYLHRGIATRAFQRHFELADHIKVSGAGLDNGLLHIELEREVPEALTPLSLVRPPKPKPSTNKQHNPCLMTGPGWGWVSLLTKLPPLSDASIHASLFLWPKEIWENGYTNVKRTALRQPFKL